MSGNLSYNIFALLNQASTNDADRPASLLIEAETASVAIMSNAGTVTINTNLTEILGVIPIFISGNATSLWIRLTSKSGNSATFAVNTAGLSNGTYTVRFLVVGTRD